MVEAAFSKGKIWVCHWCQNWKHISVYVEHSQVRLYVEEQEHLSTLRLGQSQLLTSVLTAFQLVRLDCVMDTPPRVCRALDSVQLLVSTGGPAFRDSVGVLFFHLGVAPFARCVANPD